MISATHICPKFDLQNKVEDKKCIKTLLIFYKQCLCFSTSDIGTTRLTNCSAVKTPIALDLCVEPFKLLCFTTITILYFFSKTRSTTWPIEVVVVTQGGGLLIIVKSGAFICTTSCKIESAHCQ